MKIWIDATRPAPDGYRCIKSVDKAKEFIISCEKAAKTANQYLIFKLVDHYMIELIDINHDAGDYASDGGDYTKLLDWLKDTGRNYPIHIHATNPLEIEKLRESIVKNGLQEKDPRKSVCIWIDHEPNEPNGFYRLDTVNKVKNCILWCEEHGWPIGCIDSCVTIEESREADGGSILMFLSWLKDTGRYHLFRYH